MENERKPVVRDIKLGSRITYNLLTMTFEPVAKVIKREVMIKVGEIIYGRGK